MFTVYLLLGQDTVVLGKNGRLLFILSDGSRDRIPVSLSFNCTVFVYSFIQYYSFKLIRFMWPTTKGTPGETRKKDRQAFQEEDARKEYFRFVSKSGRYKMCLMCLKPCNCNCQQRNIVTYDHQKSVT